MGGFFMQASEIIERILEDVSDLKLATDSEDVEETIGSILGGLDELQAISAPPALRLVSRA